MNEPMFAAVIALITVVSAWGISAERVERICAEGKPITVKDVVYVCKRQELREGK